MRHFYAGANFYHEDETIKSFSSKKERDDWVEMMNSDKTIAGKLKSSQVKAFLNKTTSTSKDKKPVAQKKFLKMLKNQSDLIASFVSL